MNPILRLSLSLAACLAIAASQACTRPAERAGAGAAGAASAARQPSSELKLHALEDPSKGVIPLAIDQENQLIRGITDGILAKIGTSRDAHPKAHGCVADARLTVASDLAAKYRRGLFAAPGASFDAIVRYSSGSNNPKADDRMPSTHGMAVKIKLPAELQAQVPDLPGEEHFLPKDTYKTFDILTVNAAEEFVVNDLPTYPHFIKASSMVGAAVEAALAAGTKPSDLGPILGKIFFDEYVSKIPAQLQPVVGQLLQKLLTARPANLLNETYSSWVAYAFDAKRAVKYSFVPCSKLPKSAPVATSANFLGEQLRADLSDGGNEGCFELVAQFHEGGMPSVENAALPWGDPASRKRVKLATLKLSPRFEAPELCEALSYNPAHALPDQRGIGAVQRARRVIYAEISARRNANLAKPAN